MLREHPIVTLLRGLVAGDPGDGAGRCRYCGRAATQPHELACPWVEGRLLLRAYDARRGRASGSAEAGRTAG